MKLTAIVFVLLFGITGNAQTKLQIGDRLEKFKGKLVILDFWATWCKPCIAMMPVMDSLQQQFADRVQIIPVTYQSGSEVKRFFESYQRSGHKIPALQGITGDTTLRKLFNYMNWAPCRHSQNSRRSPKKTFPWHYRGTGHRCHKKDSFHPLLTVITAHC